MQLAGAAGLIGSTASRNTSAPSVTAGSRAHNVTGIVESRSVGAARDKMVTPMAMTQKATPADDLLGDAHGEALVEDPDAQHDGDGGVDHDDQRLGDAQRPDLQRGLLEHGAEDRRSKQRVERPVRQQARRGPTSPAVRGRLDEAPPSGPT